MLRYIDSEKIEIRVPYGIDNDGEVLVPIAAVRQSIARTPTEDVVRVVRCKDCTACDRCYPAKAKGEQAVEGWYCKFHKRYVKPDDFCSYGERKEQP